MTSIRDIEPKKVFGFFYELNQIPRGSGNEKAASDFLVRFAKERGLEVEQDSVWNVIIRKPATPGYENSAPVIVQGHMDMVCEKLADSKHDFLKDPINMIVEGDILRADGTTLGGDDGIAVAYALALLDSDDIPHPPLEVLITTNEETGMDGAMAVKEGKLKGKYLFNIDAEEEGIFLVSCAGGTNLEVEFPAAWQPLNGKAKALRIEISGLRGGHSGMQIKLGRGNAIKLMARLMDAARRACGDFRLRCYEGGSKHNAIPLYAKACFTCADMAKAREAVEAMAAAIKREYATVDPDLKIAVEDHEIDAAMSVEDSQHVLDFFLIVPDGTQVLSADFPGLVQSSLNIAVLTREGEALHLVSSVRSSVLSSREEIVTRVRRLADLVGAKHNVNSAYPAWEFNPHSPLREKALEVYKNLFGKDAEYTAVHAGLECGILKEVMPDVDMLSFGPNLFDVHTPQEHLSISSVARMWEFTKKLLAELK